MNSAITRRQALQLSGVALGVGLTGCSTRQQVPTSEIRIAELSVINHIESQHTVHALLQEGDEIVYWSTIETTPADKDDDRAGGGVFRDLPTDPGIYSLYVKSDNQSEDAWTQATIHENDSPCIGIVIHLGSHRKDEPEEVSILSHTDCKTETIDE